VQKVLGFVMVLVSESTLAGWFGPSNYDECLLDNMKGVASNTAAVAIAQACRSKFPLPPPPPPKPKSAEELAKEKEENERLCRSYRALQRKQERAKEQYDNDMKKFLNLEGSMPSEAPSSGSSLLAPMEEYRGANACRELQ